MHKFILGENPQAPTTGGLWIVHLTNPVCIIEVVAEGEKAHSKKAIYRKEFNYKNTDNVIEKYQLRVHHYFTTIFYEEKSTQKICESILNDAWHWYKAYLTWEDKNIDTDEEANLN